MDATIAKPVEAAAAALRAGEPLLLYDAPGREGETDIVFAARHATPERVRLLRQRGGGLVFIAVAHDAAERLGLPFMIRRPPISRHCPRCARMTCRTTAARRSRSG